jgi:serine kinase of HPr protein (carbohydrate metabolism regulator)
VHAGCVAIGGRGVLIAGPSGAGKSDLAIRLIDRGAELVSDDYTSLSSDGDRLIASPPETIVGKIELRGVGIVEKPFLAAVPLALAIELGEVAERLPEARLREWLGVAIPVIALNGLEPSAPIKVEAALALHGLPFPCRP